MKKKTKIFQTNSHFWDSTFSGSAACSPAKPCETAKLPKAKDAIDCVLIAKACLSDGRVQTSFSAQAACGCQKLWIAKMVLF